ncbi:hypothetical protein KPC83_06205 [Collinsella sp. zg1085]|uniref:type IV toxin-antitoxin system AbiEi family antitoxin domain-containing protein n=1 Tax=Collinsella sp. zg1085 TaxID=2844380 RepID=UPI001C0C7AA2|nr:hypothetical protein [Collinsella sp. zg1085]QWT17428.1 hypothetical protein KPC83_06205 [Collinsella sp. zg1085]
MVLLYQEAIQQFGSKYFVYQALKQGVLRRLQRGLYVTSSNENPIIVAIKQYPHGIITGLTALYLHGLIKTSSTPVELAIKRGTTQVHTANIQQHIQTELAYEIGKTYIRIEGYPVPIYNRERMALELMRLKSKLPYDSYREAIHSFRDISHQLNFYTIEDYATYIPRGNCYLTRLIEEIF